MLLSYSLIYINFKSHYHNNSINCEVVKISKKMETNRTSILLGKNIVYFRQLPKYQWSQDTLAHKLKSDKGYLLQVENARRNASTDYIERLCLVFDIEPEELFKNRDFNLKSRIDSRK